MPPTTDSSNVLFLLSSPLDAAPVEAEDGWQALQRALQDLQHPVAFTVRHAEPQSLSAFLSRAERPRFGVVHYLGHGYKPANAPTGGLVFEGPDGEARLMQPEDLLRALNPTQSRPAEYRLAVVMACHAAAVAYAFQVLGIPHIVAVEAEESVYQRSALTFFPAFYNALFSGRSVREAFEAGRTAVRFDPDLGADAAAEARKFVLLPPEADHNRRPFAHLPEGKPIFDLPPEPPSLPVPPPPPRFVGRQETMQQALRHLRQERAVLLLGVSGAGKTELARQLARYLIGRRRFAPDRLFWLPLGTLGTAEDAQAALGRALGMPTNTVPPPAVLARALPRGALLVFDEAENAVNAGVGFRHLVETLLTGPARPTLIVTSQADPGSSHLPRLRLPRLDLAAALHLFAVEARLTAADLQALRDDEWRDLLRLVDGLPRALRLLARQWRTYANPRELLADARRLHDRILQDPDYPDEVKSVTVGIQLAYERLEARSPQAAVLFRGLGFFPGGLAADGLAPIFGPEGPAHARLVERQGLAERPRPDLLYLPTPFQAFARRQAAAHGESQATWGAAVLRFYQDFPEEPHYGWVSHLDDKLRSGLGEARARYEEELPSFMAWAAWAVEGPDVPNETRRRGISLAANLSNIHVFALPDARARWLELLTRAAAAAQQIGARLGQANTLQAIGDVLNFRKDLDQALEHYHRALDLFQAVGDRLGQANTLAAMSRLALQQGKDAQAQILLRQAVAMHTAIGSRYDVAADQGNFGLALLRLGRADEARPYLLQAAEIFTAIGLPQLAAQLRQAVSLADGTADTTQELHPAVAQLAPLLLGVAAVARNEAPEAAGQQVNAALDDLSRQPDWEHLAAALKRILAGARAASDLDDGLDAIDRQAVALTLAAIQDNQAFQALIALASSSQPHD